MPPLLIFGASTRAAAFSAIRAGFAPVCGDLFADADLRAFATVLDVPQYPHGLVDAASQLPPGVPWIYTGALENSPVEVERVAARHSLWGNSPDVLRRCRDPWLCAAALEKAGLPAVELCPGTTPPARDRSWLMKPLHSSAGRAIAFWDAHSVPLKEAHYFQRFMHGTPIAGAFVAGPSGTQLLGLSQQLIGIQDLNAPDFAYCGSLFPCPLAAAVEGSCREQVVRVGEAISAEFGLRGLFGIDFLFDGQQAWMTEINPRYTASMELIEYGRQLPLLDLHRRCFVAGETRVDLSGLIASPEIYCAKVILYADRLARAPDLRRYVPPRIAVDELSALADIPVAGTEIVPGQPVFTCLGAASDPNTLMSELLERARRLWETFCP